MVPIKQSLYTEIVATALSSNRERALHWDQVYESNGPTGMSWFQETPSVSLEFMDVLAVDRAAPTIDVGGGSSPLVDHLIRRGFTDLSVLDVSQLALREARLRLGENAAVSWLCEDLLLWTPGRRYALWHDRAVFHFLTDGADLKSYVDLLRSAISPGGALIIATFAQDGPESCSGLPVARYSAEELSDVLGSRFQVVMARRELHTTPAGAVQPFTWIAAKAMP